MWCRLQSGVPKKQCQRATDRDAVIKHPSGLLVLIGRGLTTQEGREVQASGVLSDTEEGEGKRRQRESRGPLMSYIWIA